MNRLIRILLPLAGLLLTGASLLADSSVSVIAVSDLTDQGQHTHRASPANPVYYYPHTTGFSHSGTIDGVTSLPQANVEIMLVKALASQGYIYHKLANKPASILLVFEWGYMTPQFGSDGKAENENEMLSLVEGATAIDPMDGSLIATNIRTAATTPRYYLTVTAMDYAAMAQKKYITLWCSRVSTEIVDNDQLAQVLPALVRTVTPVLGTQTEPHFVQAKL